MRPSGALGWARVADGGHYDTALPIYKKLYEQQGGICPHCQEKFHIEQMESGHITPWRAGGKTTLENGQMRCKNCNRKKSNR